MSKSEELLIALVKALDNSFWSSWQSTSDFQNEWDAASAWLEVNLGWYYERP